MGLRTKFNLVFLAVFATGLAVSAYMSYCLIHKLSRDSVIEKAGVMMGAALAIRGYTVEQVRPPLQLQTTLEFFPQTVPAFAATETFNALRKTYPDYYYKEATMNPTNPRDKASPWEVKIIDQLKSDPTKKELIGHETGKKGEFLYLARPIVIKDEACLGCHSTPDVAPPSMIQKYGAENGFGWKLNEVVGAQVISIPMAVPIQKANQAFLTLVTSLTGVFAVVFIVLNIMLSLVVIGPITKMSTIANKISTGEGDLPEFSTKGRDEISILARSFNRMRRSVEHAIKMLKE